MKALVILSGGADSTICLGEALASGLYDEVHAITFDYGQKHYAEIESARDVASILGASSHEIIDLPNGVFKGTSPLTNFEEELEQYSEVEDIPRGLENTFVPVRNALFMTVALNRAYVLQCEHIYTGLCQEDFGGYPDCRQLYVDSLELALNLALGSDSIDTRPTWLQSKFQFITPLMNLSKAASIELAWRHSNNSKYNTYGALGFTTTAYDGEYPPTGNDHATLLRARGFKESLLPDPLWLRAFMESKGTLPDEEIYKHDMLTSGSLSACYDYLADAGTRLPASDTDLSLSIDV